MGIVRFYKIFSDSERTLHGDTAPIGEDIGIIVNDRVMKQFYSEGILMWVLCSVSWFGLLKLRGKQRVTGKDDHC